MRVIGGTAKGRRLQSPKDDHIRPTTDRVKESIFNILNAHINIYDSIVADVFSGTGGLGIEAISRGARKVYFIDNNYESIKLLTQNIKSLDFEKNSEIINLGYEQGLKKISSIKEKIDIFLMDPPYLKDLIIPCINSIIENRLISDNGIIMVEHSINEILPDTIKNLEKIKQKKYGNTYVTIYSNNSNK